MTDVPISFERCDAGFRYARVGADFQCVVTTDGETIFLQVNARRMTAAVAREQAAVLLAAADVADRMAAEWAAK